MTKVLRQPNILKLFVTTDINNVSNVMNYIPKRIKAETQTGICTHMFTEVLFTKAKR